MKGLVTDWKTNLIIQWGRKKKIKKLDPTEGEENACWHIFQTCLLSKSTAMCSINVPCIYNLFLSYLSFKYKFIFIYKLHLYININLYIYIYKLHLYM